MNTQNLEFEPLYQWRQSGGDQIQRCQAIYKNIAITWDTIFWWNIFKSPTDYFMVDVTIPLSTKVEKGEMVQGYCDGGYGYPVFKDLKDAINFIEKYPV